METYGVIFDMDGVLVDSYEAHYKSTKITCDELDFPFDHEIYSTVFGRTFEAFAEAIATRPMSAEQVKKWYWDKEVLYREMITENFPEGDGASELLKSLHEEGLKLAIGSSGPTENVQCVLDNMPGAELFDATVNGDECEKGKPDPEVFIRSAQKLGLDCGRCLVVEDSIHGLQAARAAGMAAVGVTGTAPMEQLQKNADLVVESLRELTPQKIRVLIDNNR